MGNLISPPWRFKKKVKSPINMSLRTLSSKYESDILKWKFNNLKILCSYDSDNLINLIKKLYF